MTNYVRNTSTDHPAINILAASVKGGVEASERAGQQELLRSTVLPRKMSAEDKATFLALGGS